MPRQTWTWIAIGGLALTVLIMVLAVTYPGALGSQGGQMRLVYLVLLLALVGSSVVAGWRTRPALALRHAIMWVGIGLVLAILYAFGAGALFPGFAGR